MDLFSTLERKQKFTFFNAGSENRFFLKFFFQLNTHPKYKAFGRATKPFEIIRANIILRALQNKKALDEAYLDTVKEYRKGGELLPGAEMAVEKALNEAKAKLPYLVKDGEEVYIPILPMSLNHIYNHSPLKFEEKPYRVLLGREFEAMTIDPFDAYGYALFDSYFTNLILVKKNASVAALFDYDSLSIYFVNKQGRLDTKIALFDRQLSKRNTNHMMERIQPVVDAYYRDDVEGLKQILVQNELISSSLMYRLSQHEMRVYAKADRLIEQ